MDKKNPFQQRSEQWGKVKFKPKPYVPQIEPELSLPWNKVKNDIIEDEKEERNANRSSLESAQAQEYLKQREKNFRRNVIEMKRKEPTTWEKFDDDEVKRGKSKGKKQNPQKQSNSIHDNNKVHKKLKKTKSSFPENKRFINSGLKPENLTTEHRNFFRQKLTKAIMTKRGGNLHTAIQDMKKHGVVWNDRKDNKKYSK